MLRIYCFIILHVLFVQEIYGQQCATIQKEQQALRDPVIAQKRAQVHAQILAQARQRTASNTVYTIPVVIHVLYNGTVQNISRQQIDEQIQVLNEDFRRQNADAVSTPTDFLSVAADARIEFCLATRDPNGQPTTGITRRAVSVANIGNGNDYYSSARGGQDIWDANRYLNIWVCEIGGGTLGFTYRPGTAPPGADGVVIDYDNFGSTGATAPYNQGRTTTHEVGHWLDLDHLWGAGGCGQDDGIGDTPIQDQESNGCPTHPRTSCGSADMFMNYMDYTDDACMNMFTQGQSNQMRAAIQSARPNLVIGQRCIIVNNDAGIEITFPNGLVCSDSLRAQVLLYNYGANSLQSTEVYYQLDNGVVNNLNWTGNLNSTQNTPIALPALLLSNSPSHQLKVWTEQPNQQNDPAPVNDTSIVNFSAIQTQLLPLTEGFQQAMGLPTGWQVNNPDGAITWAQNTQVGQSSSASFFVDNWDYQGQLGAVDYLVMPAVGLPNNTIPVLQFDLAYALFTPSGYGDTLRVQASKDCGTTWTTVYEKGGAVLSTITGTSSVEFVPQAGEWRRETVGLNAYQGEEDLQLRFEHISEAENNLYLDNVNISILNNITNPIKQSFEMQVFPNPSRGQVQLALMLPTKGQPITWRLYNTVGQELLQQQEAAAQTDIYQLSLEQLPKGVYFLEVQWEGQRQVQQIVLQ